MTETIIPTLKKKSIFQEATLKVFPSLQQKTAQTSIVIALTLLGLIILGFFAINPTISTIIELNKQISDDTFVYNQMQEKIANLTQLQTAYENLQPELPIVLAAIPDSYDLPQLIGQIQTLAANNHLAITSLQSDPITIDTTPITTTSPISLHVTVSGTQDNILAFISAFNSFNRITTIKKVSIAIDQQSPNFLDATIEGEAFFLPL